MTTSGGLAEDSMNKTFAMIRVDGERIADIRREVGEDQWPMSDKEFKKLTDHVGVEFDKPNPQPLRKRFAE